MTQAALVTGATSELGTAFCHLLAQDSYHLVLVGRRSEALDTLGQTLKRKYAIDYTSITQDLSQPNSGEAISTQLRSSDLSIEILIHNAGLGQSERFIESSLTSITQANNVNVSTTTELTRCLLPSMVDQGRGKILFVSSLIAYVPGPFMAVYCAGKTYLLYLAQALSQELKGTGVSVTALCSGLIKTAFVEKTGLNKSIAGTGIFGALDADQVAKKGYAALKRGKKVCLPSGYNRLLAFLMKLTPRPILLWAVAKALKQQD